MFAAFSYVNMVADEGMKNMESLDQELHIAVSSCKSEVYMCVCVKYLQKQMQLFI